MGLGPPIVFVCMCVCRTSILGIYLKQACLEGMLPVWHATNRKIPDEHNMPVDYFLHLSFLAVVNQL